MGMFDVLLPANESDVENFCGRINMLALRFQADVTKVTQQCIQFFLSSIKHNYIDYCALKSDNNPITFWSIIVTNEHVKSQIHFIKLIHTILALPVGTADVERGFSILNHIMFDRRARLTVKRVKDISRIRINGPSLSKFNAESYALHWIKSGHVQRDNPSGTKRKSHSTVDIDSSLFNT
jgi:hypothetical protein